MFFCRGAAAFESYNSNKGYCGPGKWAIPKFISLFNEACYGHDKCYNQCKVTKTSKATCDNEFYTDMKIKCDNAQSQHYDDCMKLPTDSAKKACKLANKGIHDECMAAAKGHYEAVKRGADKFHAYNCTAEDLKPYQPTVDLKVNGSDGPITVPYNSSVTLSWNSRYTGSCTASGAWSGTKIATGGSESTGSLTSSKTYTLTCKSSTGSAAKSVQVNVVRCSATLSGISQIFNMSGGTGSFTVKLNDNSCQWTASSNSDWITITSDKKGMGTGTVSYSVKPNRELQKRMGYINAAGNTFTITQYGKSGTSDKPRPQ
jgi:hypothetical protein